MEEARRLQIAQAEGEPEALRLGDDEQRFTLDGRRITKWRPRRRID